MMDDHAPSTAQTEAPNGPGQTESVRHKLGHSYKFYRGKSITLDLPSEVSRILSELMNQTDHDPEEIFIRSLLLYKAAIDAEKQGKHMAIVDSSGEVDQNITGL
jgi:hypothetical protein